jgi:hypothetical protein
LFSVVLASALAPVGCYSYLPVDADALRPRSDVRVRLSTRSGTDQLSFLGPGPVSRVTGETVDWDDSALRLLVWRGDLRAETQFRTSRQTVSIPWVDVTMVEERRLSWLKTGGLASTVGVGLSILIYELFNQSSGGTTRPPNGGDPG